MNCCSCSVSYFSFACGGVYFCFVSLVLAFCWICWLLSFHLLYFCWSDGSAVAFLFSSKYRCCCRWIKEVKETNDAEAVVLEETPDNLSKVDSVQYDKDNNDNVADQLEVNVDGANVGSTICTGKKDVAVGDNSTEEEVETSSETTSINSSVESSESDEKEEARSATGAANEVKRLSSSQMPDLLVMTDSDTDNSQ